MPYTTVVAATTITASWGNANVRDQVVTPFATASARTSAITSPVDGMLTYRADAPGWEGRTGGAWLRLLDDTMGRGYVTSSSAFAGSTSGTGTEIVAPTLTFTAIAGRRYTLTLNGTYQSSVGTDTLTFRMRYAAGASLTTGGTQIVSLPVNCGNNASTIPITLIGEVTGIAAGQTTIGVTYQRTAGTGTVQLNGGAYVLLTDVGI